MSLISRELYWLPTLETRKHVIEVRKLTVDDVVYDKAADRLANFIEFQVAD